MTPEARAGRISVWYLLLFSVILGHVFHMASFRLSGSDLFWHIKTGEMIWQTGSLPLTDPFSHTAFGKEWVQHEWLTDLLFYGLHAFYGLLAIRLFFALFWVAHMIFFFRILVRHFRSAFVSMVLILLSVCLFEYQYYITPSTLSLFISFWFVLIWAPWKGRLEPRRIIALVPIFYVWCNLHSIALLTLGFLGLDALVFLLQKKINRSMGWNPWILFLLCLAASFLTPNGSAIHRYALTGPGISSYIDEWAPLFSPHNFISLSSRLIVVMVLIALAFVVVRQIIKNGLLGYARSRDLFLSMASVICCCLVLRYSRFLWMAVIPLIYSTKRIVSSFSLDEKIAGCARAATVILLALVIFRARGWTPPMIAEVFTPSYYRENLRSITLPVKAADYLLAHPLEGNLYNHYIWGGYLIYRLYPHYKVFIDGRAVLYGKQLFKDEIAISSGSPDTMRLLDHYRIQTLVVGPHYFTGDTAQKLGWKLLYRDEASSVYHRDL